MNTVKFEFSVEDATPGKNRVHCKAPQINTANPLFPLISAIN